MTTMSADSLAGYILEELIAFLIRNTGYRLLVDAVQDPIELRSMANGLNVIGRGALHQVEFLGVLPWIPAFTFPLRRRLTELGPQPRSAWRHHAIRVTDGLRDWLVGRRTDKLRSTAIFMSEQRSPSQLIVPLLTASQSGLHADPAGNSSIPYKVPISRRRAIRWNRCPCVPCWIRSPGRLQNTFAMKCEPARRYPRRDAKNAQRVRMSRRIGGTFVTSDACPARKEPETAVQPA
jgi:hypothetical protein